MALTAKQQNWLTRLTNEAETLLASQNRIQELVAEYNNEGYSTAIETSELQENQTFAHLTNEKMVNGVVAVTTVDTALGSLSSGQALNLLALRG